MITISSDEPTQMFVYGTLRPGCSEWARDHYTADPVRGTAKGDLLDYGPFPYADFDGDGTIVGEIVTLTPYGAHYVARVEEGAGYEAREVVVTTAEGPVVCLGWQITERTRQRSDLVAIPSGDWLVAQDEKYDRYLERRASRL